MSLNYILTSIETWLATHAPATLHSLAPPATDAVIAETERSLGVELIDDVRALLRWHDGTLEPDPTFALSPGYLQIRTSNIVTAYQRRSRGFMIDWSESPLWIPVASDLCGAYLVVDHTPGPTRGRVMTSDPENGLNVRDEWSDLDTLLTSTFHAMRAGSTFMDSRCYIEDQRVVWDEAD